MTAALVRKNNYAIVLNICWPPKPRNCAHYYASIMCGCLDADMKDYGAGRPLQARETDNDSSLY